MRTPASGSWLFRHSVSYVLWNDVCVEMWQRLMSTSHTHTFQRSLHTTLDLFKQSRRTWRAVPCYDCGQWFCCCTPRYIEDWLKSRGSPKTTCNQPAQLYDITHSHACIQHNMADCCTPNHMHTPMKTSAQRQKSKNREDSMYTQTKHSIKIKHLKILPFCTICFLAA